MLQNVASGNVTTGHDTQDVKQTVRPARQSQQLSERQPYRSQRERRPKETLTQESLGQPIHRSGTIRWHKHLDNIVRPGHLYMFGIHLVYSALVPI